MVDLVTFPDSDNDPGLGVFVSDFYPLVRPLTLDFRGHGVESILKTKMNKLQNNYKVDSAFDEDYVIVPTMESILSGDIHADTYMITNTSLRVTSCSKNSTRKAPRGCNSKVHD